MSNLFLGVHHVNIRTKNLEQSVEFYTKVLGSS